MRVKSRWHNNAASEIAFLRQFSLFRFRRDSKRAPLESNTCFRNVINCCCMTCLLWIDFHVVGEVVKWKFSRRFAACSLTVKNVAETLLVEYACRVHLGVCWLKGFDANAAYFISLSICYLISIPTMTVSSDSIKKPFKINQSVTII